MLDIPGKQVEHPPCLPCFGRRHTVLTQGPHHLPGDGIGPGFAPLIHAILNRLARSGRLIHQAILAMRSFMSGHECERGPVDVRT